MEQLQTAIDAYFEACEADGLAPTVCGLALGLDLSRQTLLRYGGRHEFRDAVRRAKLRIEAFLEAELANAGRKQVTGIVFNLKNNFGWQDRQSYEHSGPDGGPLESRVIVLPANGRDE